MAMNFQNSAVKHGVLTCSIASLPIAPPEVVADMMNGVVIINRVGVTKSKKGAYALFTCNEFPDYAFHAGELFNRLVEGWMDDAGDGPFEPGDCENLNHEIESAGGVGMRFFKKENKSDTSKSPYWCFNIL